MDAQQYIETTRKYRVFNDSAYMLFMKQHTFEEFDAQVECFCANHYEEKNAGRHILDVTPEQVEEILDDYIRRFNDEGQWIRDYMMRNAIQDVTGLIC